MGSEIVPRLKFIEGGDPGEEFLLTKEESTIGRIGSNDFVVPHAVVSGNHARIIKRGDEYQIIDLGSSNGTYVNGSRINSPHPLKTGDVIGLGLSVKLEFIQPEAKFDVDKTVEEVLATSVQDIKSAQTAIGEMPEGLDFDNPPELEVTVAGSSPTSHILDRDIIGFGRSPENVIHINSPIVSRSHGFFERTGSGRYALVVLPEAGNPVFVNGRKVEGAVELETDAKIRIGGQDPGMLVSMVYTLQAEPSVSPTEINFDDRPIIQIGRDAQNDVVLNVLQVSRFHAQIERVGQRYKVTDLSSTNGTFVNDVRIDTEAWVTEDDTIRIGSYRFIIKSESIVQYDDSLDLRVEAVGLNKWVRPDLNILQHISLVLNPREFVVVVGQSGGGKSTLVDAIAGYRPATHGEVFVNDTNVYENFDSIRNIIGYVPQKDIIHMELTVYDALNYTAQLRLPPDTKPDERHQRILEVLDDLDIAHRKDNQIKALSGGQQKRVSIGVELLTRPGLFFLDEPSSGLDPGTETALMHLMRQMADQGRTIILITHATKNVVLADKVLFLARGGHLVWFGPPDEALAYFDQYRSEQDRRKSPMEFDQIYALLEDSSKGTPEQWAERYNANPAYRKYILDELDQKQLDVAVDSSATQVSGRSALTPLDSTSHKHTSGLRQFLVLSRRNLKILTQDRFSLGLMLAASPLVGLLSVVLSLVLGRSPFDFVTGNINNVIITLFMLTIYGVMVGGLSQMREIVKETEIYKRERLVNLKILPYVLSKVWVAAVLAVYQAACYTIIQFLAFDMPGGGADFFLVLITLMLATMAGMMLGLFASALSPNANAAPLIVILFMLPQIVLGGAMVPLPESISSFTSTKWAFQGLMGISGVGSDLSTDTCWLLEPEIREAMTEDDKGSNDCHCMGTSAVREDSCNFPSMGSFYNPKIDEPLPAAPGEEPERPPDVDIPDPPPEPEDQSDTVAMAEYLATLRQYQEDVEALQAEAEQAFAQYEAEIELYQAEVIFFQEALIERETAIASAVQPAEATLAIFVRDLGWAFVDRDSPNEFWPFLLKTWGAQALIIAILFFGILVLQKRKDIR